MSAEEITKGSLLSRIARLFAARAPIYCLTSLIAGVFGPVALTPIAQWMSHALMRGIDPWTLWRSMSASAKLFIVFGLLFALWTPILIAARATCRITADQVADRPLSSTLVFVDMIRFVPAALVYTLIIGFATMIGSSMFYVPSLLVAALFALVVPTSANEPAGMFAMLRRGVGLGLKVYGKALLLTAACAAVMIVVIVLQNIADEFLPVSLFTRTFAMRLAVLYMPGLLLVILANIGFTLLYLDARRAEMQASS